MAIRRLAKTSAPPIQELQASIKERRDFGRNVEDVWKRWKVTPSKPDLAQELVPILIRKVDRGRSVPIVEAINEAIHLGQRMHGIREVAVRD